MHAKQLIMTKPYSQFFLRPVSSNTIKSLAFPTKTFGNDEIVKLFASMCVSLLLLTKTRTLKNLKIVNR